MTGATSGTARFRPILTALTLGVLALLVCGRDLARAPVYIYHDEAIYALNAHSVLTTGHDLQGLRLPLFIHTFAWVPPIAIYARVLEFNWTPVTEFTTRFPGVVIIAIDVILTYVVGRRLFRREGLAVIAAVFVMLTPAHVIHGRLATDHICGVPFFILFVFFMLDFLERRTPGALFAATMSLGLGVYGYNGAMTVTPAFLAFTVAVLFFLLDIRTVRPYLVAAAGFAVALVPLLLWLIAHPEQPADQLRSYGVGAPGGGGGLPRAAGEALYSALTGRLDAYYNFFDPSLLFFRGDQSLLDSTREVGVFLLPMAVLLPVGASEMLRRRRFLADRFVLMGFFVAPIGAVIVSETKASRALVLVPLAALVAARGVAGLAGNRSMAWRVAALVLVAGTLVQFERFYRDYVGGYRERSGAWFEGNRDGALGALVGRAEQRHAPAMFVSSEIPLVSYSWQYYVLRHGRPDLKGRVAYFGDSFEFAATPQGSVFLAPFVPGRQNALDEFPILKRVELVENADRQPGFAIYEK